MSLLRRPILFAVVAGFVLSVSVSPPAGAQEPLVDMRWEVLSDSERAIIDRLAADFYEQELRFAQSSVIEDHTSDVYRHATPVDRARFREERRETFNAMNDDERRALRNVKRPSFRNLTDEQKAPFRRHALDKLGAAGALDKGALQSALSKDV